MNMAKNIFKWALVFFAVVLVVLPAYAVLTKPDTRTVDVKVGDAFDALAQGGDNAAQQLHNRTLSQKLSDAVKNAKDTF
jgi:hypothetical protein